VALHVNLNICELNGDTTKTVANPNHFFLNDDEMKVLNRLLHPVLLLYCDFGTLLRLIFVNKHCCMQLAGSENATTGFWPALCNSFCSYYGLYSTIMVSPETILPINYRQHLMKVLLPMKMKWRAHEREQAHNIRVTCRFRPGEMAAGKVCLPLHQFIKVKRKQHSDKNKKNATNVSSNQNLDNSSKKLFFGEYDPVEFVDPFLGSLMRDPVLLTTSQRICDRAVAIQCVLRGGKDPFNNQKLTMNMLIPQVDLAKRIQEWRERPGQRDVSVDVQELKGLIDCSAFNADCFETLLDLQHLHIAALKARQDIRNDHNAVWQADEEPAEQNEQANPDTIFSEGEVEPEPASIIEQVAEESALDMFNPVQMIAEEEDVMYRRASKHGECARIVEVNAASAFVSVHVPGSGVQPFHFHAVHENNSGQAEVYDISVQEAIGAALNGCNSCVLCYGQTGKHHPLSSSCSRLFI
jgi:hypothetical protein